MKKIILLQCIFFFTVSSVLAQSTYYHTSHINKQPVSLHKAFASDSSYLFACSANGLFTVMETDSNGSAKWVKTYGSGVADDVFLAYSGNVIATGNFGGGVAVYNLQRNGGIQWQYHFLDSLNMGGTASTVQLIDSTYITEGFDGSRIVFIRLSTGGNPIFISSPQLNILPGKLVATADGGFASLNANKTPIPDSLSFIVSKFDSSCNLLWSRQYAYHDTIIVADFASVIGGGFVLAGVVNDTVLGNKIKGYMLSRLDTAGNVLWSNYYSDSISPSYAAFNSVVQTADGGFLVCGTLRNTSLYNIMSFKTDSSGNFLWARTYVTSNYNQGNNISIFNNGYVVFGTSVAANSVDTSLVIIRTDSIAQSGCVTDTINFYSSHFVLNDTLIIYQDNVLTNLDTIQYLGSPIGTTLVDTCPPIPPPPPVPYSHYFPMLDSVNIWHYVGNEEPVFNPTGPNNTKSLNNICSYPLSDAGLWAYGGEYTGNDTIIDSITYKTLWINEPYYTSSCLAGLLREDTSLRRVSFTNVIDSPEIILYDFSMRLSDSIYVHFPPYGGFFSSGWYRLDSVKNDTIKSGIRREFFLNCSTCSYNNDPLTWVESVGNLGEAIYPYSINDRGALYSGCGTRTYPNNFPYDFSQILTCFSHNNTVYFDSCPYGQAMLYPQCFKIYDSCDIELICGGIDDIASLSSFNVYPNPATDQITLNFDVNRSSVFDIEILDVQGRQTLPIYHVGRLSEGIQTRSMDVSSLASGFYMVACRNAEGAIYRKLITER